MTFCELFIKNIPQGPITNVLFSIFLSEKICFQATIGSKYFIVDLPQRQIFFLVAKKDLASFGKKRYKYISLILLVEIQQKGVNIMFTFTHPSCLPDQIAAS